MWGSGPPHADPETWEHLKRRHHEKYPQLVPSLIALLEVDERAWRAGWLK